MDKLRHFDFCGKDYVQVDELNAMLKQMKKDASEGKKPGWICDDQGERISATLALNKVSVALNKDEIEKRCKERLDKIQREREEYMPARWSVWKGCEDERLAANALCFVRWEDKKPVFANDPDKAMWFVEKSVAGYVAKKLGDGWEVVDMWPLMSKEERLLYKLLVDDEDEEQDESF